MRLKFCNFEKFWRKDMPVIVFNYIGCSTITDITQIHCQNDENIATLHSISWNNCCENEALYPCVCALSPTGMETSGLIVLVLVYSHMQDFIFFLFRNLNLYLCLPELNVVVDPQSPESGGQYPCGTLLGKTSEKSVFLLGNDFFC